MIRRAVRPTLLKPPIPRTGSAVPTGRLARLSRFGGLAAGVAGGMIGEGARQLVSGKRPALGDLLLTPGNIVRVTDRLAKLRGAAMKLGQLVSLDSGDLLPPELTEILARLRADAEPMPARQLGTVLAGQWGGDWKSKLSAFDANPIAAASIGQVHRGRTRDGRPLAIKVQYPGVAKSIDSDVDNVATLLRLSGLVPKELDLAPLLAIAKVQLREEADYVREGACLTRFGDLLAGDPHFHVPDFLPELSTPTILTMSYAEGVPIESLTDRPQAERDAVAGRMLDLVLRELFDFGLMQTDPNLANYRYDAATGKIVLLDFGATREISPEIADLYRQMLRAVRDGDRAAALKALEAFGLFDAGTTAAHSDEVLALFDLSAGMLLQEGAFDFGDASWIKSMRGRGLALASDRTMWRVPPAETLFVQRKLGGSYWLAARLKARVDLHALLDRYL